MHDVTQTHMCLSTVKNVDKLSTMLSFFMPSKYMSMGANVYYGDVYCTYSFVIVGV